MFPLSFGVKCDIPTYDRTGYCIHPDVIFINNQYVMVMTPYKDKQNSVENASIVVSNDGVNFSDDSIKNPVIGLPPKYGYYSDPDLVYHDKMYYLYYREYNTKLGQKVDEIGKAAGWAFSDKPPTSSIRMIRAKTFINELNYGRHSTNLSANILSSSFIYDSKALLWKMWGIHIDPVAPNFMCGVYHTSKDGLKWEYDQAIDLVPFPTEHTMLWHIDVQKLQNREQYYALVIYASGNSGVPPCNLYWAESTNGINWSMNPTPVLALNKREVFNSIYRSTFMIRNGKLQMWYSAEHKHQWNIYYKEVELDFIKPEDLTSNIIL